MIFEETERLYYRNDFMEQAEFEHIATKIRIKAAGVALAVVSDTDKAEDIAQEAMLRLWTLHADIGDCTAAEKLAARIARNLAIDEYRKRRTTRLDEQRNIIDEKEPTPDVRYEISENEEWLLRRIEALPPAEYQILRLRQVERKTNEEIARMLGIEKASVATMLSRARTKILNEFKERTRR